MKNAFTCYAWGSDGDWEAICVDLDLAAQGGSLEEVRHEIGDAIETYISYVDELPESERERLLDRKAPLGLRLKLVILYRISRLLNYRIGFANRYVFRPSTVPTT